ncbi:MAG: hypothetical protein ABMA64_01965 [Myxococcota bacterium]
MAALVALLVGCTPRVELPLVPVTGGTAEQREAARAELQRFEGWIGAGRLQIAGVRFEPLLEQIGARGQWQEAADRVRLDQGLPAHDVADVVRHELCHALDDAEHLSATALFARLGAAYPDSDWEHGQGHHQEAFAQLCEPSPLAAAITAAAPCSPTGVEDLLAGLADLADRVWVAYDPPEPIELGEPRGGLTLAPTFGPEVDGYELFATVVPNRLRVNLSHVDCSVSTLDVDLETGDLLPLDPVDGLARPEPPSLPLGSPLAVDRAGWPQGPALAAITWEVTNQPLLPPRLVGFDGVEWRPIVDGCFHEGVGGSLFTTDDRVWAAGDDGLSVWWRPIDLP